MLVASRELHKYFHDCKDVLSKILEKQISMSDELGRDGATVSMLQRKHHNFLQDLSTLQSQVSAIQEESAKLQAAYAGQKAMEITNREREVVRARRLQEEQTQRHRQPIQVLCYGQKSDVVDGRFNATGRYL